jgi:hypothetical protein
MKTNEGLYDDGSYDGSPFGLYDGSSHDCLMVYDVWASQSKSNLSALLVSQVYHILIAGWLYPYYWLVDKASV